MQGIIRFEIWGHRNMVCSIMLNFIRGIIDTFNHVYPQLYGVDLREGFTKLAVPVFFFLGGTMLMRHFTGGRVL